MRRGAERAVEQFSIERIFSQIGVGQDRLGNLQPLVRAGLVAEQVRAAARSSRPGDITSSSRIGSIGGLVTWAKFCLK